MLQATETTNLYIQCTSGALLPLEFSGVKRVNMLDEVSCSGQAIERAVESNLLQQKLLYSALVLLVQQCNGDAPDKTIISKHA